MLMTGSTLEIRMCCDYSSPRVTVTLSHCHAVTPYGGDRQGFYCRSRGVTTVSQPGPSHSGMSSCKFQHEHQHKTWHQDMTWASLLRLYRWCTALKYRLWSQVLNKLVVENRKWKVATAMPTAIVLLWPDTSSSADRSISKYEERHQPWSIIVTPPARGRHEVVTVLGLQP